MFRKTSVFVFLEKLIFSKIIPFQNLTFLHTHRLYFEKPLKNSLHLTIKVVTLN